jgi:hypothetical protein
MATPGKRPFWAHQGAEYLVGIAFVAQGLQSSTPMLPTLLGGLVVLNTASAKGPLAAFQVFGRRTHRVLDAAVILAVVFGSVQPFVSIESGTRLIMGLLAFALAFIWLLSDFTEKVNKPRAKDRVAPPAAADNSIAATVGRTAGRLVGGGVNAYRKRKS